MAILLLLSMAVSGGLYAGTILHSACRLARYEELIALYQSMWE